LESLKGRDHLEVLGPDGRIMLKMDVRETRLEILWLKIGTSSGLL
jgi:hypothetical protein